MGYVFCAEHTLIKCDYALKILAPEQLNETSRQRFEIEGRAIANLDHPNIVKVYNMGLDQGECPFYVMDLLPGLALSDYIAGGKGLAFDECLDMFMQIAHGLGYAHTKGIVHRDIKPSNIILLADGQGRSCVKIVDFGIAKLLPAASLHNQSLTASGEICGSPFYMSPEQGLGTAVDHRSDIYSLGCTLFETLSGRPPFRGPNFMATVMLHQSEPIPSLLEAFPERHWPQSLDLLLAKMMAKPVEDRYQSMEQLSHDLSRMLQSKEIGKGQSNRSEDASASLYATAMAARGEVDRADRRPDLPLINSRVLKTVILVGILCLSLGGGFLWLVQREQKKLYEARHRSPVSVPLCAQPVDTVKQIFERAQDIKSVRTIKDGRAVRQFTFPSWTIGEVYAPGGRPLPACGVQYLPADLPLILEIGKDSSVQVLSNPEIVSKIGKDEFATLLIDGVQNFGHEDAGCLTTIQSDNVLQILKAAGQWTKLSNVQLSHTIARKDILDQLSACKNLTALLLDQCSFDSKVLAGQPYILHLQLLSIANGQDMRPLCHALAASPDLMSVRFWQCILSPDALLDLRQCRSVIVIL